MMTAEGFGCPWCPIVVVVVDSEDEGRAYMEAHLDAHFAQPIGRPQVPQVPPTPLVLARLAVAS